MKKRRFYYTSWAYFIGILVLSVPLCTSTTSSDPQQQDIFVFPSMQMDSLPAKSDHVPMVEVIYRGQPPPDPDNVLTSTTSTSREVITTESPIMSNGNLYTQ